MRREVLPDSPTARVERDGAVVRQVGEPHDWNGVLPSGLGADGAGRTRRSPGRPGTSPPADCPARGRRTRPTGPRTSGGGCARPGARRSQLATWALSPLAALWSWTVLRPLRWYAALTCPRTGWGTRQHGPEVELAPAGGR
ncbi:MULTISPECIES: hypothetical protein [Kitasatospora]|nr:MULTISPECIES: hypothetical protein [Kitasatospora]